jgi:hypothetical protein
MRRVGPRAKRRITWVAGAVVAAAVVGAAFHFAVSDRSSGSPKPDARRWNQSVGVSYGDSAAPVQTKVGSPTSKQGACWIYDAKDHTVHGAFLGDLADRLRYCFGEGPAGGRAVTAIEVYVIRHYDPMRKKWYPGGWNHAVVVMAAPSTS